MPCASEIRERERERNGKGKEKETYLGFIEGGVIDIELVIDKSSK